MNYNYLYILYVRNKLFFVFVCLFVLVYAVTALVVIVSWFLLAFVVVVVYRSTFFVVVVAALCIM